jgi:hypothetical protein
MLGGRKLVAEVSVLGLSIHMGGDLGALDDVGENSWGDMLWIGCIRGANAWSIGKDAMPESFELRTFTGEWPKECGALGQGDITAGSHGQPSSRGDFFGGVVKSEAPLAEGKAQLDVDVVGVEVSGSRAR